MRFARLASAIVFAMMVAVAMMVLVAAPPPAAAQTTPEMLQRIEAIEQSLKEIRTILEDRQQSGGVGAGAGAGGSGGGGNAQLTNRLDGIDARIARMEEQIQTLARYGALAPSGTGTGGAPQSNVFSTRDQDSLWVLEQDEGEAAATGGAAGGAAGGAGGGATATTPPGNNTATATAGALGGAGRAGADAAGSVAAIAPGSVFGANPDEHYETAINLSQQQNFTDAEAAFAAFISAYPDDRRIADAYYWLGRVQFVGGKYEQATLTLAAFQRLWPNDPRIERTTLWIGEAASNFASGQELCALLNDLPLGLSEPSRNFFERLDALKQNASCRG